MLIYVNVKLCVLRYRIFPKKVSPGRDPSECHSAGWNYHRPHIRSVANLPEFSVSVVQSCRSGRLPILERAKMSDWE